MCGTAAGNALARHPDFRSLSYCITGSPGDSGPPSSFPVQNLHTSSRRTPYPFPDIEIVQRRVSQCLRRMPPDRRRRKTPVRRKPPRVDHRLTEPRIDGRERSDRISGRVRLPIVVYTTFRRSHTKKPISIFFKRDFRHGPMRKPVHASGSTNLLSISAVPVCEVAGSHTLLTDASRNEVSPNRTPFSNPFFPCTLFQSLPSSLHVGKLSAF